MQTIHGYRPLWYYKSHLFDLQRLFGENVEEVDGVGVVPPVHLPHDGEKVPDALGLPAPHRAQQTLPLRGCGRRRRRQEGDIAAGKEIMSL